MENHTQTGKGRIDNYCGGNCNDHSGIEMWMRGIGGGIVLCSALLAYSVFWQAPSIRAEVAREIARLDIRDKETGYELQNIKRDISEIRCSLDDIKNDKQGQ